MGKLDGKVAFVTGAAMGNGAGIAHVFAELGAKVLLVDISETVHDTAKEIVSKGLDAVSYVVDVANFDAVKEVAKDAYEKYEKIDILVNNAGVIRLANFLDMSDEMRDFQFQVNINGVWNFSKAVLPYMIEKNYGKIVNMSSVTGTLVADEGETAYATTKAAIWGFTKALAREVAKHRITVNAICPGYIMTPMAEQIANESDPNKPSNVIDGIASGVPLGRLGKIEEVGQLAGFLASDESSYITGTHIVIDGGSTLPETVSVGVK
ncbi:oxidoreductase UcpA [Bacillus cereus]|uniref:SDR family oxidoreductase UcpA n=1 Tax=Bacillus TaxID=1386 RepID=UPI000468637A|nr:MULTISPECIES: SDR family oxidoreductase UcpA [Bacillus]PFM66712.1 oxidoreductase UcpA [Bacillus cereus]KMN44619.1 short-chain dehydrogenase [Bacillus sp. LK2]MED0964684.1 SDR family oxidoreductase UcpA [Bacillus paramycoides]MED0980428.1 SDR family oxidoreductase UcpA [Bacillus paramycoides]MED1116487.1 SDR family oxidoreductase UcpA [Bacillus paramycoides]